MLLLLVFAFTDTACVAQKRTKKKKKKKEKTEQVAEAVVDDTPTEKTTNENGCEMYGPNGVSDKEKTLTQYSLYREHFKQGNYAEALPHWQHVYDNGPGLRKQTYIDGEKMFKQFMTDATTDEAKRENFDLLMAMWDARAICWGESAKLTGKKGLAYKEFYPEETEVIYDYMQKAVENGGNETSYVYLYHYFTGSVDKYNAKALSGEDLGTVWGNITTISEHNVANNPEKADKFQKVLDDLTPTYEKIVGLEERKDVQSCADVVRVYGPEYTANSSDPAAVKKYYRKLLKFRCTSEPVFLEVAMKYNEIEPSAGKCRFIAKAYFSQSDWAQTEAYYRKAMELETNPNKKAEDLMFIAKLYKDRLGKTSEATKMAREVMTMRPGWGDPYILIGLVYASAGKRCGSGTGFDSQRVVWAAIDMWNKAKREDPSSADKAQKYINKYYQYMPTKADCFLRGLSAGQSYSIDCLGVSTVVRYK